MPTALIVEDEKPANELLAMLVQLRGYRTDSAFTGGEALEKLGQQRFDIIFLDLMLPDINGYEVCKSIKERSTTRLIPVVMVTARVAAENRIQSFRVGADDYIPKPYTPEQIYQAMEDADALCRQMQADECHGEIPLAPHDDGAALRQIAHVRTLLLARSTLDAQAVARVGEALAEIAGEAEQRGEAEGRSHVATLAFRVEAGRATFVVRDPSGWLVAGGGPSPARRSGSFDAARFDEVAYDHGGRTLTLAKSFTPTDAAASE